MSPTDKSNQFLESCRFAHTWQGSFGVTIEAPLQAGSLGLLADIPESLGRKTTNRIARGLKLVDESVHKMSPSYILDNIKTEDDILILDHFPKLSESLKQYKVEFFINFSPTIKPDNSLIEFRGAINQKALEYIDKIVTQIRKPDNEFDIQLVGFPEKIQATREGLLKELTKESGHVTIKGHAKGEGFNESKISLNFPIKEIKEYKKAISAHENFKVLIVKCRVKKRVRGWDVLKLYSFDIYDA